MYGLDFTSSQQELARWSVEHPDDPLGPVSIAASVLFSEFDRLGILESQFYTDDTTFTERKRLTPDPEARKRFDAALASAESLAQARLAKNADDHDALFAMAMTYGLRADYTALVEKRNLASLSLTKHASKYADQLLAIAPDYYDAYLATGVHQYIVGSLFAPVRWMLRLGGYTGDKKEGLRQVQLTADHGHYLAPFARLLLAIAALRDHDKAKAKEILSKLRDEYPTNPLYAREIARIDAGK